MFQRQIMRSKFKVEKILKGSLDLIPSHSPSKKNQIMGGKLGNIAGHCKQTLKKKKFVDNAQQCFDSTPEANFPAQDLNFN